MTLYTVMFNKSMGTPSSVADAPPEEAKVIFWTHPVFNTDGSVDENFLKKFLTEQTPRKMKRTL